MPKIRKAIKVRLKTNLDTETRLSNFCGSARFLWNKSLAMNLERLEKGHGILWYNEMAFWLKLWKQSDEYAFLKECPSQVLQQKLMDQERAFRDCFDRTQPMKRLPVFKKRGDSDSIRYPQGFRVDNRRIFLPKIGWVGFYKSREIEGRIKNITIRRTSPAVMFPKSRKVKLTIRTNSSKSSIIPTKVSITPITRSIGLPLNTPLMP